MNNHVETCRGFVEGYLGRPWEPSDGLPETDVRNAESRLGITLPAALRTFYLCTGAVSELCTIHNTILPPEELAFEEGYLMVMDENQSVVSWGIKQQDLETPDPEVWQRNNSYDEWYSEEKSFLELLTSMFDWYKQLGVWSPPDEEGSPRHSVDVN